MQLIRDRKCLWCLNPGHKYVDCNTRKSKKTMRTAAQRIQEREDPKANLKKVKKPEIMLATDTNRVSVNINGNKVHALIDLQTEGCNLLNAQFAYLYKIPTRELKPPLTLMTAIKGSRASINKAAEVELDWGGHRETITCCIANLQGEDLIIGKPTLCKNKAVIQAGPYPVTIYPEGKELIQLTTWTQINPSKQEIRSAKTVIQYIDDTVAFDSGHESDEDQQNTSVPQNTCETDFNTDEWEHDPHLGVWFKIHSQAEKLITHAVKLEEPFNPLEEFADLFPDEIPSELPLLRIVNHKINLIPGATWKPERIFSHDRFKDQITEKIHRETKSGRTYPTSDTENAVLMFTQPKKNSTKARFLLNCVPRNKVTIKDKTPLPNMDELLDWISRQKYLTKLDMADGYHNVRHEEESEKHTTFICHLGYFRSKVMQQGDCNAPATMMKLMQRIFQDKVYKDLVIYLDDIIIASKTYEEYVKIVRQVLTRLREEKFYLNKDKCQFMSERVEVLGHIITPKGLSADPIKIGKVIEFQITHNRKMLQAFIGIVIYLRKFCPNLASVAAPLTDLQGSTAIWRWTDLHTKSFEECKKLIHSDRVIKPINYDSTDPVYLITDASDIGVGAWLGQGPDLESLRPARFYSRKLNPSQLNYTTKNKELFVTVVHVAWRVVWRAA